MKASNIQQFTFPIGYEKFHKKQLYNFQLNRPYAYGYARSEDLKEAGKGIRNFRDWKTIMLAQANKALSEDRILNAAFYFRAAEFYIKSTSPEKDTLYDKFIELFYKAFEKDPIERFEVPYEDAYLPVLKISPATKRKGTIVIHGGFEWFPSF